MPNISKSEKELVDVETLSFKPAGTMRLQTAREGMPFTPGNIHGHGRSGIGWVGVLD